MLTYLFKLHELTVLSQFSTDMAGSKRPKTSSARSSSKSAKENPTSQAQAPSTKTPKATATTRPAPKPLRGSRPLQPSQAPSLPGAKDAETAALLVKIAVQQG
jgi:hypothetical protein